MDQYVDLPQHGGGVSSLNGLTGALTLVAGSNITITPGSGTLTISATGSTGIASINADTTAAQTLSVGTAGTDFAITNPGGGSHVFNLPTASATNRGALSSADWSTFNGKQSALTFGNLTDAGTDGIVITGGTGAVIGSGTSIAQHVSDSTHNGYLSSTDWSTFNSKQAAGNYITALTGDATATGPGSVALTLATVNGNVGSFGTASNVSSITVNAKGLITAASNTAIQIAESQVTNLVSDLAGKQPVGNYITALTGDATATGPGSVALTLATVNGNVGSFGSSTSIPSFTVNAKGLITAASGNVVIAPAGTLTGTTLASNVVSSSLTSVGTITSGTWNGTTIAIANGGTNNTSAYTAGSVIFSNGTSLTQNNSKFYWDNTAFALGLGVIPAANVLLDVVADTSAATQVEQLTGYGANNIGIRIRHARGTSGTPTALQSGDPLGFIGARGYGTSQFAAQNTGSIQFSAIENFTNTANGTSIIFNTTPTGSVTLAKAMQLNSTDLTLSAGVPLILSGATTGALTLTAAASTTSYSVTFPSAQGAANTVPVNNGSGVLTWTAFPTPYLVSTISGNTSAVSGTTYLCNTSGAAFNLTLPVPASGAFVAIKDSTGSFQTNNLSILQHGGEKIEGLAATKLLITNWGAWSFFSDGTDWFMGPF